MKTSIGNSFSTIVNSFSSIVSSFPSIVMFCDINHAEIDHVSFPSILNIDHEGEPSDVCVAKGLLRECRFKIDHKSESADFCLTKKGFLEETFSFWCNENAGSNVITKVNLLTFVLLEIVYFKK